MGVGIASGVFADLVILTLMVMFAIFMIRFIIATWRHEGIKALRSSGAAVGALVLTIVVTAQRDVINDGLPSESVTYLPKSFVISLYCLSAGLIVGSYVVDFLRWSKGKRHLVDSKSTSGSPFSHAADQPKEK
ncbi:hypothetical protein B7Y94_03215 [Candidatus Saccharibacteria bacterium 32-49-12]|nr:MAG: hypothetical protein B7Y94_03215 [Candidatus Saccharibacteria bacterium 32-49-12]